MNRVISLNSGEDDMATKLDKTLKREIEIDGQPYTVAISPEGIKVTQKGFRKGSELTWKEILGSASGEGGEGTSGAQSTAAVGTMSVGADDESMGGGAGGGGLIGGDMSGTGGGTGGGSRTGGAGGTAEGGTSMPGT